MKSKDLKRQEALERNSVHNSLSTEQKIIKLNLRFGSDKGAKWEREKLAKKLEEEKNKPVPQKTDENQQLTKKGKKFYQKPKKS